MEKQQKDIYENFRGDLRDRITQKGRYAESSTGTLTLSSARTFRRSIYGMLAMNMKGRVV